MFELSVCDNKVKKGQEENEDQQRVSDRKLLWTVILTCVYECLDKEKNDELE